MPGLKPLTLMKYNFIIVLIYKCFLKITLNSHTFNINYMLKEFSVLHYTKWTKFKIAKQFDTTFDKIWNNLEQNFKGHLKKNDT